MNHVFRDQQLRLVADLSRALVDQTRKVIIRSRQDVQDLHQAITETQQLLEEARVRLGQDVPSTTET